MSAYPFKLQSGNEFFKNSEFYKINSKKALDLNLSKISFDLFYPSINS